MTLFEWIEAGYEDRAKRLLSRLVESSQDLPLAAPIEMTPAEVDLLKRHADLSGAPLAEEPHTCLGREIRLVPAP